MILRSIRTRRMGAEEQCVACGALACRLPCHPREADGDEGAVGGVWCVSLPSSVPSARGGWGQGSLGGAFARYGSSALSTSR